MGGTASVITITYCSFCDHGDRVALKLVDRLQNPESFWLPDSYWRHVHDAHPLSCAWVGERFPRYAVRELSPEHDLRILLHLGDCKDCHKAYLAYLRAVNGRRRREREGY